MRFLREFTHFFALIVLIVYTSPGNAAFGTAPLSASTWMLMAAFAIAIGLLEELRKRLAMRAVGRSQRAAS